MTCAMCLGEIVGRARQCTPCNKVARRHVSYHPKCLREHRKQHRADVRKNWNFRRFFAA
jgi:hypothetical protein